ncbi:hypothetical protein N0V95_004338 [Ascochyta clinopodiicola]|nr:hypothetical protein N0V95_004338 [Ascochyta clinopodiicola]
MSKRPSSPHSFEEQQESKKPKLEGPAELESLVPNAGSESLQPLDVAEATEHSLDERSSIISKISDNWLEGTIADYLPEHAYPANGRGNILQWPFALLEALLELSIVTAVQDEDLRSKLSGAFVSAKRYSLARSLKNIKAVHDSFVKKDSTESSESEPLAGIDTKDGIAVTKTGKSKTTRKAGDGFTSWKPDLASVEVPAVQPHWGIVPRTGSHRPSGVQPSAKTTNAAVTPPLWEDRKGAVRIKRGSRYINGYDQALHMSLSLMDMRPVSRKNQTPKRQPVLYYYEHGMPTDWNDVGAINDLNKALQEAIKAKSNKEPSFTAIERTALAKLFALNKEASIWDIAELFNDLVHPVTESEDGQYPKGRFTESIRHEYLTYKSTYDKGEVPTDATEKDVELEKRYAEEKTALAETRARRKRTKASKALCSPKMSNTAGVTKKRTPKKTTDKPSIEEILTQADEPVESTVPMSQQPHLSKNDEAMLEAAGAYTMEDVRSSSPLSAVSRAIVDYPTYGSKIAVVEQEKQEAVAQTSAELHKPFEVRLTQVSSTPLSGPVSKDESESAVDIKHEKDAVVETHFVSQVETELTETRTVTQTEIDVQKTAFEAAVPVNEGSIATVVSQPANVSDTMRIRFVEKAVRDTRIDENYSDDDELGDLL